MSAWLCYEAHGLLKRVLRPSTRCVMPSFLNNTQGKGRARTSECQSGGVMHSQSNTQRA